MAAGDQHRADDHEQRRDHARQIAIALYIDTGKLRRLLVAADGVHETAMLGVLQEDVRHQYARQHNADDDGGLQADGFEIIAQQRARGLSQRGLQAVGQHTGRNRAAADVPQTDALMHELQRAGRQHIGHLADQNQEHGQLIQHQRYADGDQNGHPQTQAVPQVHAHERVGGNRRQRAGRHIKAVRGHGYGRGDAEYGGNRHGAQNIDHIYAVQEIGRENGKYRKAYHQCDNGRPVQQQKTLALLSHGALLFHDCILHLCISFPLVKGSPISPRSFSCRRRRNT